MTKLITPLALAFLLAPLGCQRDREPFPEDRERELEETAEQRGERTESGIARDEETGLERVGVEARELARESSPQQREAEFGTRELEQIVDMGISDDSSPEEFRAVLSTLEDRFSNIKAVAEQRWGTLEASTRENVHDVTVRLEAAKVHLNTMTDLSGEALDEAKDQLEDDLEEIADEMDDIKDELGLEA